MFGALAGIAATVPMTVLMLEWHRRLPQSEKYPLPPREIFDELIERAEIDDKLREPEKANLAVAGHFAYGAANGVLYRILIEKPTAANGAAFALTLWAWSYLGWLPALRILRPATEHPQERNALMISAHIVWGASLGLISAQQFAETGVRAQLRVKI